MLLLNAFLKTKIMKSLPVILALFFCLSVMAQKHTSLNSAISDDGKRLSVKIKGTFDGKAVDYDKTFDVTGMNNDQKESLKKNIYDSLGIKEPVPPRAPLKPHPLETIELVAPLEPTAPTPLVAPPPPVVTAKTEYTDTYLIGGEHPFTKEIRYNPKTGILYMKYRFVKNGEQVTMEKSLDAKDKSKEEQNQIIKRYEKEIGVRQKEAV
jgi:hypothetical protein